MKLLERLAHLVEGSNGFEPLHVGHHIRRAHFWEQVERLPAEGFRRALDAGCGSASYAAEFAARFPGIAVAGLDVMVKAAPGPPNCSLLRGDLRSLPFAPDRFDFIWCIDVLEHVPDNEAVVRGFARALAPGGYLYLHVPFDHPKKRILPERLFRRFEEWAEEEHVGAQRSLDGWKRVVEDAGLEVVGGRWTFGFWGELAWELEQLTRERPNLSVLTAPLVRGLAHLGIRRPSGERRSNLMVLARRPDTRREGSPPGGSAPDPG